MRNILIFPDGTMLDFTYPSDRKIELGTRFHIKLDDGSTRLVETIDIKITEESHSFYLEYVT